MMAAVIPFPLARRVAYVRRQVHRVVELSGDAGERYIAQQVQLQRDAMVRKGVAFELIEVEMRCLESAIRSELWRHVFAPGGAA